ncbi:MAG: glutamate synthase subunit beta [Clostridiales bacterium]|nr:glutamate synthase subunit beta [Clostridiales bacterium]
MGKPSGFLEYDRKNNAAQEPMERIRHWDEFHPLLERAERQKQGARCMACGVPFCQSGMMLSGMVSGCPLHNLIPEWNDLVYTGNFEHATQRLLKTNNFPEFTGRVCPAPCEASCTCGLNGEAVTIRDNELGIIEDAFANGWITPRPPRVRTGKTVAVVGSGPAGLAAADQLNRRGHLVTVFEREDRPGGLLMYGIPNMKLEKKIVERRIELMKAEGIQFVTHTDIGRDKESRELMENFDAVLLCGGAKKPRDLNVPGRELDGVHFAVDFLTAATKSLLDSGGKGLVQITAQGKNVIVLGGGDTGNDCVGTSIRQGCKSVVQLEVLPQPPSHRTDSNPWPQWPLILKTDYGQEEAIALYGMDPRSFQTTIARLLDDGMGNLKAVRTVQLEPKIESGRRVMVPVPGSEKELPCELLLIAIGFLGSEAYVPQAFGAQLDERGNVKTKDGTYYTGIGNVFAAGDMRRGQSLVVWAIAEGREAAKEIDAHLMGYTNL